jgi:hypothetical protein
LLFAASVMGSWAWFNVGVNRAIGPQYTFTVQSTIPGFEFRSHRLDPRIVEILSTTNLVNGLFRNKTNGQEVRVLFGSWPEEAVKGKTLINHTPDVCWINTGWKARQGEQPDQVGITFGNLVLPFESRSFESPDGHNVEFVIWCTLVNGYVMPEPTRFGPSTGGLRYIAVTLNMGRLAISRLWHRVRNRLPARGRKQFLRLSVAEQGDWRRCLESLQLCVTNWIELSDARTSESKQD